MGIRGDSQVSNALSKIGNKISDIGGKMMGFGTALTAGITLPLAGLVVQGLKYSATVQNLETDFKVLLGSEEEAIKMTSDLKKMGAETPFEITGLSEVTKTLLQFGISQEKVLPLMGRLGDISLGNEERFKGLGVVIGQVSSLGRLQAGDLNQLINRGWNPLNEITARTGETMKEVRKRMSEGKVSYKEVEQAMVDATDKGGKFYNGMAEGSKTLEGKLSTLKDTFNALLQETVKPLFDFLNDTAIPYLTNLIDGFTKLDPAMQNVIRVFGLGGIIVPILITLFGGLITVVGGVVAALAALSAPVLIVILALTEIGTVLGITGGAILGVSAKTGVLSAAFERVSQLISAIILIIKGDLTGAMGLLIGQFGMSADEAANFVMTVDDTKRSIVKLIDVVKDVKKLLGTIFTGDAQGMQEVLQQQFGLSAKKAKDLSNDISHLRDKAKELMGKIKELNTDALAAFIKKLGQASQWVIDHKKEIGLLIKVMATLAEIIIFVVDGSIKQWRFFKDRASDAINNVTSVINGLKKAINALLGPIETVINAFSRLEGKKSAVKAIPKFARGIKDFIGGLAIVGEEGPELIDLPAGSNVYPHNESSAMLRTATNLNDPINRSNNQTIIENYNIDNVTIDAKNIKEWQDVINIFRGFKTEYVTRI